MMEVFQKNCDAVLVRLAAVRIVPVLAIERAADGLKVCELLMQGGLPAAEITFRTAAAEEIIREASRAFPDMLIGAGTVLNPDDLERAFAAGAQFAVAPGLNPHVVQHAVEKGWPFFPGIMTPSELEQAMELGLRAFKFFPAEAAGGVKMLTALIAPYRHRKVRFIPTGGVSAANARAYLRLPEVAAVGGTWLGKDEDLGAWDRIAALITEAAAIAREENPC